MTEKSVYTATHPPEGRFRLSFGRCGVHTQGHTVNNPLLHEQVPENVLWMNKAAGRTKGLSDGDDVVVRANGHEGTMKVQLTDLIHPETVFMLHGFGHTLPVESRACGKGVADNRLMAGGLENWDRAGGGMAMQETFVEVCKSAPRAGGVVDSGVAEESH